MEASIYLINYLFCHLLIEEPNIKEEKESPLKNRKRKDVPETSPDSNSDSAKRGRPLRSCRTSRGGKGMIIIIFKTNHYNATDKLYYRY